MPDAHEMYFIAPVFYESGTITTPPVPWQTVTTPTPQPSTPSVEGDTSKKVTEVRVGDVWKHEGGRWLIKIKEDQGAWVVVDFYESSSPTIVYNANKQRAKNQLYHFWTLVSRVPQKHIKHYFKGLEDV